MAQTLQGIVSSDKRDKTITVAITSRETHPLYKKQYTRTRKYTAHDEQNIASVGDKVEIAETRPISATKHFKLVKILEKSHETIELKEDIEQFPKSELTSVSEKELKGKVGKGNVSHSHSEGEA